MRSVKRTAIGMAGIAATLLLHSVLFAVAVWGDFVVRATKPPDAVGAGANAGRPQGESSERRMIVLIKTEDMLEESPAVQEARLAEPSSKKPSFVEMFGPNALPLPVVKIDLDGDAVESSDAELIARIRLAGIYESQIRARIQRAWTLPAPISEAEGESCRVQIHQTPEGRIDEVVLELEHCKGSGQWQQSLSDAIFMSSPLPAPPHPSVFVDRFSLVFQSDDAWNSWQLAERGR